MDKRRKLQAGFTLVETAVVIAIGSFIIAASAAVMNTLFNYTQQARISTTQLRVSAINDALLRYLAANGQFPCPARLTDAPEDPAYGMQIGADCNMTPPVPGTFQFTVPAPVNLIVRTGAVPVRTLNLPDQYMDDPYGDKLTYAVTEILASPEQYGDKLGAISVIDTLGNSVVDPAGGAHFVIVSHGKNRAGAYSHGGTQDVPCDPLTLEGQNCSLTATFMKTPLISTKAGATLYDDYVFFGMGHLPTTLQQQMFHNIRIFETTGTCPTDWFPYVGLPPLPVPPPLPSPICPPPPPPVCVCDLPGPCPPQALTCTYAVPPSYCTCVGPGLCPPDPWVGTPPPLRILMYCEKN